MPPKRKGGKAKGSGGKKGKKAEADSGAGGEPSQPATIKDAVAALKVADAGKVKISKVDQHCHLSNAQVHEDFDCMLNQTNINHNNNKFYLIQVLQDRSCGKYYAWNRWGRVGEIGQNAMKGPFGTSDEAIKDFKKKFKDKTKNIWDDRKDFQPAAGKYTLLEMDQEEDEPEEMEEKLAKLNEIEGIERKVKESELDKPTQSLMNLIFDNDMFKEAMQKFDIDVKKMPLGKLSKSQIAKGFECLEEIENAVKKNQKKNLDQLTSRFYTLIPHNFGRQRPPIIQTLETVRQKMDMLLVLGDIELAQAMQKDTDSKKTKTSTEEVDNPIDVNYDMLQCDLEHVKKTSKEFKMIEKYTSQTKSRNISIQEVWKVNRHGELDRFSEHEEIDNRKLLWHGTNVAVVAAILKGGLRIMPHSGGRVGSGIYFASENGKSAAYTRGTGTNVAVMFLNEVALGKEKHIMMDDWTLKTPPSGFDSIIAKGRQEPDPKYDITIDSVAKGKKVVVPQHKAIPQAKFSTSNFHNSEYLVYKESQNTIRYLLQVKL